MPVPSRSLRMPQNQMKKGAPQAVERGAPAVGRRRQAENVDGSQVDWCVGRLRRLRRQAGGMPGGANPFRVLLN